MSEHTLTRRTLLHGAAGGAAALGLSALPAWARPVSHAAGVRRPDSRPFPHLPAGHVSMPEIKHVVVLMMENHSFDNLLGMAGHRIPALRGLDGLTVRGGKLRNVNRDASGAKVFAQHAPTVCQLGGKPSQAWQASHISYANGRNDGFVLASGADAMWFWDQRDLPTMYSLARHFPLGERYFCSVLAQTAPNRRFLFAATASGVIDDHALAFSAPAANGTIFDRFDQHGVSYGVYSQGAPSWLYMPNVRGNKAQLAHGHAIDQFYSDAAGGRLPQFSFVDPDYGTTSEENPQDIQVGEDFVATVVHALMRSPQWRHTALFLTYDEHGGYYDHVPPPRAIKPDAIKPQTYPGEDAPGGYDRYGFRVPMIVVSPWARRNYISRQVQDHTSVLAFVERKWNLPALTFRDANAHPMTDYFDFSHATFASPPAIAAGPALHPGIVRCEAQGYNPPLPTGVS